MSSHQANLFIEKLFSDTSFRQRADEIIKLPLHDTSGRQAFIEREGFLCTEKDIREAASKTINDNFFPAQGWEQYYHWLFFELDRARAIAKTPL